MDVLRAAIRRQTIASAFTPVMMGSAFKNKGVQPLLDGVVHYLPNPQQVTNIGLDLKNEEAEACNPLTQRRAQFLGCRLVEQMLSFWHRSQVELTGKAADPFVGLAFKLEEGRFGQLTYMRIYQV